MPKDAIRTTRKKKNDGVKNAERFRGFGSFAETHVTYCRRRCCEAQNDSRCYIPKERKRITKMKNEFWNARGRK